jgi:hypothetical protein
MTTINNPKNSNPPYFPGAQYNPTTNNSGGSASTQSLVTQLTPYFLKFPGAQGQEFLSDVVVNGDLIVSDTNNQFVSNTNLKLSDSNLIFDNPISYIQFGDGTTQNTAPSPDDINTVYNDISNTFVSPNIQTFQGSNATLAHTGPLQFSNVDNGEFGAFSVNPNNQDDLTLYSNQPNGGFTIRNVDGNSFTMNPTTGNVCTFINPLKSTFGITGQNLAINTTGNDTYSIDSKSSQGFGLTIINSTGNNAELSLSNGGAGVASITCTGANALDFGGASLTTTGLTTTGSLTLTNGLNTTALTTNTNGLTVSDPINVAGGVSCQEISCSTLNTNGNTITSGAINAGAISGSQLTLTNGGSTSLITTDSGGLNISDDLTVGSVNTSGLFSSNGGVSVGGLSKFASVSNLGATGQSAINAGLYIGRNITNSNNEFDIMAVNPTTTNGINIYSTQNTNITSTTQPEISITNTRTTINADLYVNPANTLYVNTIIPANTGPIQMAGGTFLATNPASNSNDTTIATTSFVNTAIGAIPSGALIQSGKVAGSWVQSIPNQGPNSPMYINGYYQMLTYTTITLPIAYGNTNYTAVACLSDLNNPSYTSGGTQWMGGVWHSTNINNASQFTVYVFCSWRGSNSGVGNSLPSYNISWITHP